MSAAIKLTSSDIKIVPVCFEKSVIKAFEIQLSSKVTVKSISMKSEATADMSIGCMSTVTIQSSSLTGALAIAFPVPTFLALLERMLDEKADAVTAENADAAGEMLNIIYATGRKDINESGFNFATAIPSTVFGQTLALSKSNLAGTALYFDCDCDLGRFVVMLSLRTMA